MRRIFSFLFSKKVLGLALLAGVVVGGKSMIAKYTGPGEDILVPEGTKPSWR